MREAEEEGGLEERVRGMLGGRERERGRELLGGDDNSLGGGGYGRKPVAVAAATAVKKSRDPRNLHNIYPSGGDGKMPPPLLAASSSGAASAHDTDEDEGGGFGHRDFTMNPELAMAVLGSFTVAV